MSSVIRKTIISEIDSGFNAVMSEPSPDHYDDIVGDPKDRATGGWVLSDYVGRNDIALFNHDKNSPIGTFENVRWENGALRGRLKMAPEGTSDRIDELRKLIQAGILRGCERMRRDGGSVFRARANTGDPRGPIEACPLMRTHAR